MPDSLPELELRRAGLVKQLARLGDLRSGSISGTSGRCGKPNCHCHRPGQPVHGPNPRLTYKLQGKTVTESLPTPTAQKKAAREKAAFQLEQQFQRIFHERHQSGQLDLEAVEMAIRSTVHQTGADAVTELLRFDPPGADHRSLPCGCGHTAQYVGM